MTTIPVKGWCPGALRPMETGDGLLVRVRIPGGRLDAPTARSLDEAARLFGNGTVEMTRRANLQIRGVTRATLDPLLDRLDALALLEPNGAEAEAVRNVIGPPLAGVDPSAVADVRPAVAALERRLSEDPSLHALPGKFGVVVDDGGATPMTGVDGDVVFHAVAGALFAVGLDRPGGVRWVGTTDDPAATLGAIGRAFVAVRGGVRRMRDLPALPRALDQAFDRPVVAPRGADAGRLPEGVLPLGLPLGRADLARLAHIATRHGDGVVRLSPWRAVFVAGVDDPAALRDCAAGLITVPDDPRARLVACPGLPGCRSGHVPAATDALSLADALPPGLVLHVSGCAKGCAAGRTSHPVVLVGRPLGGYDVVRNGRAQDAPVATLPDLAAARRYLADLTVHA
ncbi:MAG: precorrin-3B synthase [Rhodospirillales bacterium]